MRVWNTLPILAATLLWHSPGASSFVPPATTNSAKRLQDRLPPLSASIVPTSPDSLKENIDGDFWLSPRQVNAVVKLGSDPKQKVINPFGFWCLAVSLVICPIWYLALQLTDAVYKINDDWDPHREFYDGLGKTWAKSYLTLTDSYPSFTGELELLRKGPHNRPCLFVANHASWLDIPVLCTCTDQVFKFIAKGELGTLPCIGHQLTGGQHIMIDREDRRSQLRSFKQSLEWIKKGVPIMAFPEGRRSDDGRLLEFKGGLFAIAVKTQIPIVPITLSHTHAVMPPNALFPVQPGAGKLHVHVHEAIDVCIPGGQCRTEKELEQLVKECFFETLPKYQRPVNTDSLQLVEN